MNRKCDHPIVIKNFVQLYTGFCFHCGATVDLRKKSR